MESVNSVNNSVNIPQKEPNAHMKNAPMRVGVIIPPDAHYKPVLYSHEKATAEFNQLNKDIYDGVKKSKNINKKKTPLSVKILAGIGAICAGIYGVTKLIRR